MQIKEIIEKKEAFENAKKDLNNSFKKFKGSDEFVEIQKECKEVDRLTENYQKAVEKVKNLPHKILPSMVFKSVCVGNEYTIRDDGVHAYKSSWKPDYQQILKSDKEEIIDAITRNDIKYNKTTQKLIERAGFDNPDLVFDKIKEINPKRKIIEFMFDTLKKFDRNSKLDNETDSKHLNISKSVVIDGKNIKISKISPTDNYGKISGFKFGRVNSNGYSFTFKDKIYDDDYNEFDEDSMNGFFLFCELNKEIRRLIEKLKNEYKTRAFELNAMYEDACNMASPYLFGKEV